MKKKLWVQTKREDSHAKMEAEPGARLPQWRNTWGYQKLQEAKKDLPPEPSAGVWSCQLLDFRLPTSRTLRE